MVGVANGLVETVSLPDLRVRELPTWLLSQAHLRAHRILQERLAAVDARGHHVRVLSALQEHGPLPQVHIGSHAALDRGDLSIAVDELAAAGFVERAVDTGDRRRKVVSLTEAGRRRLADLATVMSEVQGDVLAPLDDTERAALLILLAKLQPGAELEAD